MTPTQRSYLISFLAGAVGFGMLAVLELVAQGQPLVSWQPIAAAFAGGVVAFARDYLKNQSGARLEKPDEAIVTLTTARTYHDGPSLSWGNPPTGAG